MSWLKNLYVSTSRRSRRAGARRRPVGKRRSVETLEDRLMLSADTPFTGDGQPWAVSAHGTSVIEAENYDYGGEGVAYHGSYASNPGGAYRPNEGVGVEGPSANDGGVGVHGPKYGCQLNRVECRWPERRDFIGRGDPAYCTAGRLTGYPVTFSFVSRYLNGFGFIDASGFKSLSIR